MWRLNAKSKRFELSCHADKSAEFQSDRFFQFLCLCTSSSRCCRVLYDIVASSVVTGRLCSSIPNVETNWRAKSKRFELSCHADNIA